MIIDLNVFMILYRNEIFFFVLLGIGILFWKNYVLVECVKWKFSKVYVVIWGYWFGFGLNWFKGCW